MLRRALGLRFRVLAIRDFRLLLADRLLAPASAGFSLVGRRVFQPAWSSRTQITQFGVMLGGHATNHAAGQNGGSREVSCMAGCACLVTCH